MKIPLALTAFLLGMCSISTQANNDDISRISNSLCDFIKADDRSSIRKKLKAAKLDLRRIYTGLVCQPEEGFVGGSLLRTASYYGSVEVSTFLINQISGRDLSYLEHDGLTTLDWTKTAVGNGSVKDVDKSKAILTEMLAKAG